MVAVLKRGVAKSALRRDGRQSAFVVEKRGRLPLGALGWLLLVVMALTWTPLAAHAPEIRLLLPPSNPRDIVVNLLLFAPIAVVVAGCSPSADERARLLARVAVAILLLSLVVEAGQLVVNGRTVATFDVVLNVGGATLAAIATRRLREGGMPGGILILAAISGSYFVVVLLLGAMQPDLRIQHWNHQFAIQAGNEVGGARAYRGTVTSGQICAGEGRQEVCAASGASEGLRRRLALEAESAQRITLSATVVSSTGDQRGPARIVTFSQGTDQRNATLAQTGNSLVLRVRTPRAGVNGDIVEFRLPEAITTGVPTHVLAVYQPDYVVLSARSGEHRVDGRFVTAFPAGWWLTRPPLPPARKLVTPTELNRARLVGLALLAAPVGMAIGWLRLPLSMALLLLAVAPPFLGLMARGSSGLALNVATFQLGVTVLVVAMGMVVGRMDRRTWQA